MSYFGTTGDPVQRVRAARTTGELETFKMEAIARRKKRDERIQQDCQIGSLAMWWYALAV